MCLGLKNCRDTHLCICQGDAMVLNRRNLVKLIKRKKAPGISSNRIPYYLSEYG
jgi:hypothetical protein